MYNDEFWTIEAMIQYGGGFVCNLGRLYRLADSDNQQRLKNAFPEYFTKYSGLAKIAYEKYNQEIK